MTDEKAILRSIGLDCVSYQGCAEAPREHAYYLFTLSASILHRDDQGF